MPKLTKKRTNILKAICVLHQNKHNIDGVVKFTQLPKTLKIEYGLKFLFPFLSIELTNAIGLGVTASDKYLYKSLLLVDFASIDVIIF